MSPGKQSENVDLGLNLHCGVHGVLDYHMVFISTQGWEPRPEGMNDIVSSHAAVGSL